MKKKTTVGKNKPAVRTHPSKKMANGGEPSIYLKKSIETMLETNKTLTRQLDKYSGTIFNKTNNFLTKNARTHCSN
jgi:hypothetical protein